MSERMSQNAIGRALGLSSPAMVKLKKQGCPMDSLESVRAWRAERQNVAFRKPEPSGLPGFNHRPDYQKPEAPPSPPRAPILTPPQNDPREPRVPDEDFQAARTRREIAEANKAEMEEARLRGEYLIKADFERHLFTAGRMLRDALTNCSRRIGAEVAGTTDPDECEAIIDREHRAALAGFAQSLRVSLNVTMDTPT